jgi:hypothetical protein
VYVLRGDDVVNAGATRGNYVFVWTGMLRLADTDGELAAVLSHEIGHVLARHTMPTPGEEANAMIGQVTGEIAEQVLISQGYGIGGALAGALISGLVGALVSNPEAQRLELEADHIGFFLMADAGYDPREALNLWRKMAETSGSGGGALQFFSTHPASGDRLAELDKMLPEAIARYQTRSGRRARGAGADKDPYLEPGDSFALSEDPPPQRPPPEKQSPDKRGDDRWVVVEATSDVRTAPGPEGSPVATLKEGDVVVVAERYGRWYRITSPMDGFVRGSDLTPPF